MEKLEEITGIVLSMIYKNEDNGYAVCEIESEQDGDSIICVGNLASLVSGENVELEGHYDEHGKYGVQFKVTRYRKNMPQSEDGIRKYLGSGILPGIGLKTADKIVEKFGDKTLDIIENDYIRLSEIRGITGIKAKEINLAFVKQKDIRDAITYLARYDISTSVAIKIYEKYGDRAIDKIEKNPYILANDIRGIGFKTADEIATRIGIDKNSINRIAAGVKYILSLSAMNGHTFLPISYLKKEALNFLMVDENLIDNAIIELQMKKETFVDTINSEKVTYVDMLFYSENIVAMKVGELATSKLKRDENQILNKISKLESEFRINLADKQKRAILEAINNEMCIITGGPGTGKTTIINFIIRMLEEEGNTVLLAAPTGRAAKRMTETTGVESRTIHRLLEVKVGDREDDYQKFEKCETNPIEADVIIIDESSMIDIYLASSLLRAVIKGTKVIWVGDHNQLPPVGPGNFLRDLISSNRLPMIELTDIFRQSEDSYISINAHNINKGISPEFDKDAKDFFFIHRNNIESALETIKELMSNRIPNRLNCTTRDIQVLTPTRKGTLGTDKLNESLQEVLNIANTKKKEKDIGKRKFRVNDRVMQTKNNYNLEWYKYYEDGKIKEEGQGVFNGEQGEIYDIREAEGVIEILFDDDKRVNYTFRNMEEIELAYAITVHKAQGSEYNAVVIPLIGIPEPLLTRNLLYTAVTRAKKLIMLVGSRDVMDRMINNNKIERRYSGLCERLNR